MERKHPEPPSTASTLQEEPEVTAKRAKLVLKPPKFLTAKQKGVERESFSSLLEAALQLETAEDVLQRLLELLNAHKLGTLLEQQEVWSSEEVGRCIGSIAKLAKTYREDVNVCCLLVHVVEMFGVRLSCCSSDGLLPKNFQLFALSLADHGMGPMRAQSLQVS